MHLLLSPPRSTHTHSTPSQLQVLFLKIAHHVLSVVPIYTGHGANHWTMSLSYRITLEGLETWLSQ